MVFCPICDKQMNYINNSHLKKHGLTPQEFKEKYSDFNSISNSVRESLGSGDRFAATKAVVKWKKNYMIELKNKFDKEGRECKNCPNLILFENRNNIFCSKTCSAIHTNKNRTVVYSEKALENLRKSFLSMIKTNPPPKTKFKVIIKECIFCKKTFEVNGRNKEKKMCSKDCLTKWRSINNFKQTKTFGKCGYYKGVYCSSSWELAFLVFNKDLGKDIKRCELFIEYELDGKTHNYFPDFIMDNIIYEIKGREEKDVAVKTKATKKAGHKIKLIRKKEILPIIKKVKEKYGIKDITLLYDKLEV